MLDAQASGCGIVLDARSHGGRFAQLLRALHQVSGERVVVLTDEYDKPILDVLGKPEIARANRDFLRGLYGVIKSCDAHIRFTLLTGVSKFSKANLFSGLNNLEDITLDPRFAAICGYTESDLDTVFAPELAGLDRKRVREWYNGYNWRGDERVYNPFDILLLFRNREYRAWWFETGTPTFLLDTLVRHGVNAFALDGLIADDELLSSFEVDEIAPEALLFQTGYLTVEEAVDRGGGLRYRLGYPNLFKVIERAGEGSALWQLTERGYAEKHRAGGEPVHLIGVEFSEETRNVANFETAAA
ncbi:MAG: AAA family ATPase [Gammaproteobacteria bacterium]|nr:AAA family ATPase [Gammaproteobacteria bacterium]